MSGSQPPRLTQRIAVAVATFVFVMMTALALAGPAAAEIKYDISFGHPENHTFQVTMTVPAGKSDVLVAMPAWNALYEIRDFAYRAHSLSVLESNGAVPRIPDELDKQTWRLCQCASMKEPPRAITFQYSIDWNDPGPFDSQLNEHHAFLNLAEVLMYEPDRRSEPVEVEFRDVPADWKLIAELRPGPGPDSFVAPNYDALVDAPVEAGKFSELDFDQDGAHFRVAVDGKNYNQARLQNDLQRITGYEMHVMGGAPFREYTFLLHLGSLADVGGGGMEHANSTAISAQSWDGLEGLCAHELFHAWNVKRIRPQAFEPIDYTKEQYTRVLWFAEGVTSTYASYTLVRTGLWSKAEFYDDLASQITDLQSRSARKWQSVEDSSLDTWLDKYAAYNDPDRSISYYGKGQILGVMLDLAIRDATSNHKSLDDVMRLLNDEYAKQEKFYNGDAAIRAAVGSVAGTDFGDFFGRYVAGVDEIPYGKFLALAGLELKSTGGNGREAYSIDELPHATERQMRIREGILRGTTDR
ncbi:MAG: M61 family metallopeptidase [Candidatus Acidiferrales bacterium]